MMRRELRTAILRAFADANFVSHLGTDGLDGVIRRVMDAFYERGEVSFWEFRVDTDLNGVSVFHVGVSTHSNFPTMWVKIPVRWMFPGGFEVLDIMDS